MHLVTSNLNTSRLFRLSGVLFQNNCPFTHLLHLLLFILEVLLFLPTHLFLRGRSTTLMWHDIFLPWVVFLTGNGSLQVSSCATIQFTSRHWFWCPTAIVVFKFDYLFNWLCSTTCKSLRCTNLDYPWRNLQDTWKHSWFGIRCATVNDSSLTACMSWWTEDRFWFVYVLSDRILWLNKLSNAWGDQRCQAWHVEAAAARSQLVAHWEEHRVVKLENVVKLRRTEINRL